MNNDQAQVAILTYPDRYKTLMRKSAFVADKTRRLKILSFGCSLGDEIANIRAYFPNADVYGCDLNEKALEAAKRSVGHLAEIFYATPEAIAANGPYDVIFALSVLCMHPPPKDFAQRFPFSRFDEKISMLDGVLVEGGRLAVKAASYLFSEASAARRYSAVRDGTNVLGGGAYLFNRDGSYVFRTKASGSRFLLSLGDTKGILDDWHICDDLFVKDGDDAGETMRIQHVDVPVPLFEGWETICSWSRSNFDGLDPSVTAGCIEIREEFCWARDPSNGEAVLLTRMWRSSFFGEDFIEARERLKGADGL